MSYLHLAKEVFASALPAKAAKAQPCSEAELDELERQFSMHLPAAYREFLLWTGNGGPGFWSADIWFYRNLQDANKFARELMLTRKTKLRLPEDAFVLRWQFGGPFLFFRTSEGNDPPVYLVLNPEIEARMHEGYRSPSQPADDPLFIYSLADHSGADFFCASPQFSSFFLSQVSWHVQKTQEWEEFKRKWQEQQGE